MKTLDDLYDYTFNKYVFSDSFHLPTSVSDLRIFTEKVCKEIVQKKESEYQWSQSEWGSKSSFDSKNETQNQTLMPNAPIGLDSLSKTFDIINIVGKGNIYFIDT